MENEKHFEYFDLSGIDKIESFGDKGCFIVRIGKLSGLIDRSGECWIIPLTEDFKTIFNRYIVADFEKLYDSAGNLLTDSLVYATEMYKSGGYVFCEVSNGAFLITPSDEQIPISDALKGYNFLRYLGNGMFHVYKEKEYENENVCSGIATIDKLLVPCEYKTIRKELGWGIVVYGKDETYYIYDPSVNKLIISEDIKKLNEQNLEQATDVSTNDTSGMNGCLITFLIGVCLILLLFIIFICANV